MNLDIPLEYTLTEPVEKSKHPPLLIMIHGYGADHFDLHGFASYLNKKFMVVSIRAPHTLPWGGYAWYEINYSADASKWTNIPQAIESRDMISRVIDQIHDQLGTDPHNTHLLGFSQGAILSYAVSMNHPEKVRRVMALSGYIEPQLLPKYLSSEVKKIEYFTTHGIEDPVIPIEWSRQALNRLEKLGLYAESHEYHMGHGINQEAFLDLQKWLLSKKML